MKRESPVTIEDVADAAGVSRSAVSKVIRNAYGVSDAMRSRVQAAIEELGYRPSVAARSMRGRSYTIGIEIPSLDNPFFAGMIAGAMYELEGSGYQVIVAPTGPVHGHSTKAIQALADRRVDGIVVVSAVESDWLEELALTVPIVTVGQHYASINYDTIADDDYEGASLVVDHLADLGHERIVHLTVDPAEELGHPGAPHARRASGYLDAMERRGLEDESLVLITKSSQIAARERTLDLLDAGLNPTAIFAGHDDLALGVLAALAERNITTERISVVGYDNSVIAEHPLISLTSVDQSALKVGHIAVKHLMSRISGRKEAIHTVVVPELRVRKSSTAIESAEIG